MKNLNFQHSDLIDIIIITRVLIFYCLDLKLSAAVLTLVTSDNIPKFEHSLMLDDEITPARARARTEQITGGGHDG